jgi:hypothetical protein
MQESECIHLALVVPDIKIFGSLKRNAYILKPHDLETQVKLHVLVQRKQQSEEEIIFAFALTQLGLVEPKVANLQYPEEIDLGWSDEDAPINKE